MTRTNLDHLESIARAATPGPWLTSKTGHDPDALCVSVPDEDEEMSLAWDAGFGITVMSAANAAHVVATDPASTLALIAELRAERQRADEAIESLDARWEHSDHTAAKYWRRMREAERTLADFEKAHTPTDDEREALLVILDNRLGICCCQSYTGERHDHNPPCTRVKLADEILALRRSEVPEPSAVLEERERAALHAEEGYRLGEHCDDIAKRIRSGEPATIAARPEPQGAPSDAQLLAKGFRDGVDFIDDQPGPWGAAVVAGRAEAARRVAAAGGVR